MITCLLPTTEGMRLQKIEIERQRFGDKENEYHGYIEFEGKNGKVMVSLTAEHCAKMFAVIADGVVDMAREVATELKRECMLSVGAKPAAAVIR